jgi:hypothetical protein
MQNLIFRTIHLLKQLKQILANIEKVVNALIKIVAALTLLKIAIDHLIK